MANICEVHGRNVVDCGGPHYRRSDGPQMANATREELLAWKVSGTIDGSGEVDIREGDKFVATFYGKAARQNAEIVVALHATVEAMRRQIQEMREASDMLLNAALVYTDGGIIKGFRGSHETEYHDWEWVIARYEKACAALTSPPVEQVRQEWERLKDMERQVKDVLIVNWIAVKDGNYKQALHDLVTWEIQIHDDPAVSKVATDRQQQLAAETARADKAEAELETLRQLITPTFADSQHKMMIENLAMFVRRLYVRLRKHEPDAPMIRQANTYLKAIGQAGTPLRAEEAARAEGKG